MNSKTEQLLAITQQFEQDTSAFGMGSGRGAQYS